jgi:hypothetical protein
MPIFDIDTAVTCISRERRGGQMEVTRILEVQGRAAGGGRNRARFVFSADVHRDHPAPVGYLTDAGEAGLSLIGWLPAEEYEAHRRIVDAGGPLQVHYETRDGREGYLRRLALGRADAALRAVATPRARGRAAASAVFAMPL